MKGIYITMIFSIFLVALHTKKLPKKLNASRISKNKFTEILNEKYVSVNGKDTTKLMKLDMNAFIQLFIHTK